MLRNGIVLLLGLTLLLGLAGCSTVAEKVERPVWPKPPETARYEYVTTFRTNASLTGAGQSFLERMAGAEGLGSDALFAKPYDVAAHNGIVVVSDTVTRSVLMLLLPTKSIFRIGAGGGDGHLTKPTGVAMDGEGRIYVADVTAKAVKVYEANGHYSMTLGGKELLERPTDVAVNKDGSRIYVVDTGGVESLNHRVQVFDATGEFIKTIGHRGVGDGEFNLPVQAAVNDLGDLYVLDAGNFRVQVFSAEGDFIRKWGRLGRNWGDLARPRGIAIDADGLVYVVDAAFGNFQVFRDDGQLMLAVGEGGPDAPGRYSLLSGIAVDSQGWVYLVDQHYRKLDVIRKLVADE